MKEEGISFIVRVKNEENVIEQSIRSISSLNIPHNIHVILNTCTDRTEEIVEKLKSEGMPIYIHKYDYQISRAGYENLITDKSSPHSMVEYTNWCMNKSKHAWIFRWDADFLMTDELRRLLNSKSWKETGKSSRYYIPAKNSDSDSAEHNLFSGPYSVDKYIFWETISPVGEFVDLDPEGAYMIHMCQLKVIKSYWLQEPWFINDNSEEAAVLRKRFELLNTLCGKETTGCARRSDPNCPQHYFEVRKFKKILYNFGIQFYM